MKMFMIIASEDYESQLQELFQKHHFSATLMASTAEFLQYGEVIFLLGMEDTRIDAFFQLMETTFAGCLHRSHHQKQESIRILCLGMHQFYKLDEGGISDRKEETSAVIAG